VLEGLDELFDGTDCSMESLDDDVVELVLGGVSEEAPGVLGAIWERIAYGGVSTYRGAESSQEATRC